MTKERIARSNLSPDVLMLTTSPFWVDDGYGIRVREEAHALAGCGLSVGVLSALPPATWRDTRLQAHERLDALFVPRHELLRLPERVLDPLWTSGQLIDRSRTRRLVHRIKPRLVHAQGIKAGSLALSVRSTIPVVLDIHGDIEAETALTVRGQDAARWQRRAFTLANQAFARADALVVVSQGMADWLSVRAPDLRDVATLVVPCAVHSEAFKVRPVIEVADRITVCYLGGLQAWQSAELIAATASRMAAIDHRLDFWVITPERHDELRRAFASHSIPVRAETMTNAEVRQRLCEADIGIVPRQVDPTNAVACPTKIGEYLAAGLPVLVSDALGNWVPTLEAKGLGLSLDSRPDRLAAFLEDVRMHRSQYASKCRVAARLDWSWGSAAHGLLALYAQLGLTSGSDGGESDGQREELSM